MNSLRKSPFLNLLLASCALIAMACAGMAARSGMLAPAMAQAWGGIRVQVVRELGLEPNAAGSIALADADVALAAADPVKVAAVEWPLLDELTEADVARRLAAQAIGPITAESLRGRLADFVDARAIYTRTR